MIAHLLKQAPGCPCCVARVALTGSSRPAWRSAQPPQARVRELRSKFHIPPSGRIRLEGGTVVDPASGGLLNDTSILVDQGRIVSVDVRTAVDPAAERIDVAGKFVVPGYNDMHTHVLELADPGGALALMLAEGVTGFRQMSGSSKLLRERASKTLPVGQLAPEALEMPGDILTPLNASSAAAVVAEMRKQQQEGADFIKSGLMSPEVFIAAMNESRRLGIAFLGHLQEGVDASTAARGGFKSIEHLGPGATVWASCSSAEDEIKHADSGPKFNMAVLKIPFMRSVFLRLLQTVLINPAAFARPAHVERLKRAVETYDEARCQRLIASFLQEGTWHVPTLVRLRTSELADLPEYRNSPYLQYMPADKVKKWRKVTRRFEKLPAAMRETYSMAYPRQLKLAKRLADGGVSMMTGTDGGWLSGPGLTLQEEFSELGKAGISPLRILQMTTIDAARYLGRMQTMGSVAAGRDANMVILDANPLQSVANLGRIAGVVRAGYYYRRQELDALTARVAQGRGYLRA